MSVASTELAPRPAPGLRLIAPPATEPPYDDETPRAARATGRPVRETVLRLTPAPLHLVPPLRAPGLPDGDESWSRPRTPLASLAPAQPFVHAFVQRLLEVLAGVRPVTQLQRDTTPDLYDRLRAAAAAAAPRDALARPDARAVRSVHVQTRPDGVGEACATVKRRTPSGVRAVALALRVEGLEGRWCCTELDGLAGLQGSAGGPARAV